MSKTDGRPLHAVVFVLLLSLFLLGCEPTLPETAVSEPATVTLIADGESQTLTSEASNVRELLTEAAITLADADEVVPPPFTPLSDGLEVTVVRVTESLEAVPKSIPFTRKTVRNETMAADDPPIIVQAGKPGLQEETVRIVYRDGLEAERWVTQVTVIEPAQDEIVMIGIGAGRGNVAFSGSLAFMSDGTAVILRGQTAFPEQLNTGSPLDGRVFSLSPDGSHLLYTRAISQSTSFNNSLWVVNTQRGSRPRELGVQNVLWADWNPASLDLEIAYTTANSTNLPPGWEANNDLWLGEISPDSQADFTPQQIIEAYPATYGWWGGNYAWSPTGAAIAYSYADEVGVINLQAIAAEDRRVQLQTFTEYNTLTDWVWVPTLTWSPNGRYLSFTIHSGDDPQAITFDSWIVDTTSGIGGQFVNQTGMWGHLHWNQQPNGQANQPTNNQIAFLRTTNPLDSLRSSYTLWLMDQDGSNARQTYPPPGENSFFAKDAHFMVWGPSGNEMAFVFDNALYLFTLEENQARRINQDDALISHPTWAPYGAGIDAPPPEFEAEPEPDLQFGPGGITP